MTEDVLISAENIKQYFDVKLPNGKKASLKAVDDVSLKIYRGETLGLVGESGCGKSTLGKTLLHLYPLTDGKIIFDSVDISNLKGKDLKQFRCKSQMIFQDPSSCLNPRRKIGEILMEPFEIHNMYTKEERKKRILELCDMVGLSESYLGRFPHEMSGGQKQRVGIARALALNPQLIVCDEPVSALDVSIQAQVINLLEDLQKKFNLTYLFISHNLSVVKHCCQRIGVMYLGGIVELSDSDRIYENPLHPYTKALISAIPIADASIVQNREILSGDIPSPVSPPKGCTFHTRCPKAMDICKNVKPVVKEIEEKHFVACHLYD